MRSGGQPDRRCYQREACRVVRPGGRCSWPRSRVGRPGLTAFCAPGRTSAFLRQTHRWRLARLLSERLERPQPADQVLGPCRSRPRATCGQRLRRAFARRQVLTHRDGVVDQRFLDEVPTANRSSVSACSPGAPTPRLRWTIWRPSSQRSVTAGAPDRPDFPHPD